MMSGQQQVNSLLVKLEHNKTLDGIRLSEVINELLNLSASQPEKARAHGHHASVEPPC
jgi:hypothetical protein